MKIREAEEGDLEGLLNLYTHLHENTMPEKSKALMGLWYGILEDSHYHIIIGLEDEQIVSSVVLVVILNLTHHQRPYALIENVITHRDYRKRGYGTALLNYASDIAQKADCYKMMLLTGSKLESTLDFYEKAGYNKEDKTGLIKWL